MNSFFVTTPIYYVNDRPHIGHAYTTVIADVLARYHRMWGEQVTFLTGTDEHGQKIQAAAEKQGLAPQQLVDQVVVHFKEAWLELGISNDIFMRTTLQFHKDCVRSALQKLYDQGDIYSQDYEGWYSVGEEIFYTEKDLVDGKSPLGYDVQLVKEKNYFFKMSKYQEKLIQYIQDHPKMIQPEYRKNEVLGFLKKPLGDLCISRPVSRMSWGIPLPFDDQYVTYVWFDALLNYPAAIGLTFPPTSKFLDQWKNAHHIIGKDILITHSVYWTTMLMGLDLPLPEMIFAHGWWLTESNEKMSKSKGSVVRPLDVKNIVGVDPLRYFLTRDIHFGNDAQFSVDLVVQRINSELANNLGNLVSRVMSLMKKFYSGTFDRRSQSNDNRLEDLKKMTLQLSEKVQSEIQKMAPQEAIGQIVAVLTLANQIMEQVAPWKLAKENPSQAYDCLYDVGECVRICASLLWPVMPEKIETLRDWLGLDLVPSWKELSQWDQLPLKKPLKEGGILFPRIDLAAVLTQEKT